MAPLKPLCEILRELNLVHLIDNFEREKVTSADIGRLSNSELELLGVVSLGDRHRLRASCQSTGSILSRFLPSRQKPYSFHGNRKKKSTTTWTKKVVCLSDPSMECTPTFAEKQILSDAGLGEKVLNVKDISMSPSMLRDVLLELFPKLTEGGGYELLSCVGNKRVLVPISGSYSPQNIKDRTGQGRVYVRPIQNPLNMDPEQETVPVDSGLEDKCQICQEVIPVHVLKNHLKNCSGKRSEPELELQVTGSSIASGPAAATGLINTAGLVNTAAGPSTTVGQPTAVAGPSGTAGPPTGEGASGTAGPPSTAGPPTAAGPSSHISSYSQYCSILYDESILLSSDSDDGDQDITVTILRSLMDNEPARTASDLFQSLNPVTPDSSCSLVNICRTRIWDGAVRGLKRKSFNPANRISVLFTDSIGQAEGAVDVGGPRREFFSLVLDHIRESNLFEGPLTKRVLSFNSTAMANDSYYYAGQLLAMSLVHGGPSPTFFSSTLYESIAYGFDKSTPGLEDAGDRDIQSKLEKIQSAKCLPELEAAVDEAEDFLSLAGVLTHIQSTEQKHKLVSSAVRFYVLDRTRSAYERLLSGLETLGVLQTLRNNPVACREAFLEEETSPLSAEGMRQLFQIAYSDIGSNQRVLEEMTISFWLDYLLDAEEGEAQCSLKDILAFASGTSSIPITNFPAPPSIEFLSGENRFPTANTCSVIIRLPTTFTVYDSFKEAMDFGILNSQSFGVA